MEKSDREELLVESNLGYIEALDREAGTEFYSKLAVLGAIFAFIASKGIIKLEDPQTQPILVVGFLLILYLLYLNGLATRRVGDIYRGLIKHINENKISDFKIKPPTKKEIWVYYKKKY